MRHARGYENDGYDYLEEDGYTANTYRTNRYRRRRRQKNRKLAVTLSIVIITLMAVRLIVGWNDQFFKDKSVAVNRLPSVPEALTEHVYLDNRGCGACNSLTGDVLITVVFVDDIESSWTEADKIAIKNEQSEAAKTLTQDAAQFGVNLQLIMNYMESTVNESFTSSDYEGWVESVLENAGLPKAEKASAKLESMYDVKEAPILFYVNRAGRSFAIQRNSLEGSEYSILYRDAGDFRHELNHLFGAEDYYYPEKVKTIAKKYFPDSIMMSAEGENTDSLTAYLIGWTDTVKADALSFLYETADMTQEELLEENKKELFTGRGTKRIGEGTYTGDLVDGMAHGKGKMVWDSGITYEGDWENNLPDGEGTMIWTDGTKYTGEFEENMIQGYGTMTWASGATYTGQWKDGSMQGEGTLTYASGHVESGTWENNELVE